VAWGRGLVNGVDILSGSRYNVGMKTLHIQCPDLLADRLARLVREGWVADEQQALVEALRRFLDSHRPELIESQVLADVNWGLHGKD